jgi:hypothetical protein
MRAFTCAAIILATVAASAPFARNALAQAGSTGGTAGKQYKGASGGEEQGEPKSQRPKSASLPAASTPKSSGCGNVVGAYKWPVGITTIKSGGVATGIPGVQGTWMCANGQVTIVWNNGYTDHLTPIPGGFSAVNNLGMQFTAPRM